MVIAATAHRRHGKTKAVPDLKALGSRTLSTCPKTLVVLAAKAQAVLTMRLAVTG